MKTRIITAVVGILVLIGVLFTFDTMIFNLVIAAITLIAIHEIYMALGFEKKDWLLYAVTVPYTLLIMLSSYSVWRALVMPASFLLVLFYAIYLVVRNGTISFAKTSGLVMFSGIVMFCFYSFIRLKELLPVAEYGYDAIFFILLILCFAWGGDTCAYFAGRAFGKHKLCPVVSPKKTVEGAIGGVLGTMVCGVVVTVIYSIAADRLEGRCTGVQREGNGLGCHEGSCRLCGGRLCAGQSAWPDAPRLGSVHQCPAPAFAASAALCPKVLCPHCAACSCCSGRA